MTTNNDQDLSTIANDILEGDYTSAFARLALEMDAHLVEAGEAPSLTVLYDALNELCRSLYDELGDAGFPISAMFFANKTDDDFDDVIEQVFFSVSVSKWWSSDDGQGVLGEWDITTSDAEIWSELKEQGHDLTGKIQIG
jgi:hypothetical protein